MVKAAAPTPDWAGSGAKDSAPPASEAPSAAQDSRTDSTPPAPTREATRAPIHTVNDTAPAVSTGENSTADSTARARGDDVWSFMYSSLVQYCKEESSKFDPNIIVTVRSIPENLKWMHPSGMEVGLGRWMHTQNKLRRQGKLRPDRMTLLEELIATGMFMFPLSKKNSLLAQPYIYKGINQATLDQGAKSALDSPPPAPLPVSPASFSSAIFGAPPRHSQGQVVLGSHVLGSHKRQRILDGSNQQPLSSFAPGGGEGGGGGANPFAVETTRPLAIPNFRLSDVNDGDSTVDPFATDENN